MNKKGEQTSIGHWAKAKGYLYTLLSRNNADNQILQVRFAKVACFVAGTQLDAIGGNKAIQDLKAYQDSVWAYDHTANKRVLKVVTGTSQKQASALVTVATAQDTLYATPEHPFYLPQLKKYVPASELRQGNHLQLSNGTCTAITSTRWLDTLVTVYNISVAKHHNYFAEGVLVHNADCDTLWAKFTHYPKMNEVKAKVQGWKDTKLEKAFVDDMGDKNLANKVFGEPKLVEGWAILSKKPQLRKKIANLETLNKVKDKFNYNGKAGKEALEEVLSGHKSVQKFVDNLKKADELIGKNNFKFSGAKSGQECKILADGTQVGKVTNGKIQMGAWDALAKKPNLRKKIGNLETLVKIESKVSYSGKSGYEALSKILDGHKNAQKFIDNLKTVDNAIGTINNVKYTATKSSPRVRIVDNNAIPVKDLKGPRVNFKLIANQAGDKFFTKKFFMAFELKFDGIIIKAENVVIGNMNKNKIAVIGQSMGGKMRKDPNNINKMIRQYGVVDYAKTLRTIGYDTRLFIKIQQDKLPYLTSQATKQMDREVQRLGRFLTYDEVQKTLAFKQNKDWAEALKAQGYTVIDIGNPNRLTDKSAFYDMEKFTLFGK
ncbi:Hint domain-containing protein [uncultured Microscilla sp.]|uniref:Hint domain-containing protein n=1 Tax=uncultured Microscilla sp. TaxID=432653 RepID=UPI00260EF65F|nr:Hint domain-containing protein [uncultured Microscilla sp.]